MSMDAADEDLMVQYQRGEVRAFEVLLSRHRKPVYNFILRFVGDKETAEDLLQEAFMRVIKGAEAYKRNAKFTTWLYTIARNLCVDQTRRRKHRKHASLDAPMDASDDSGTLLDVIASHEMASDRKSVNKQLHATMHRAIAALSEEPPFVSGVRGRGGPGACVHLVGDLRRRCATPRLTPGTGRRT